MDLTANPQSQEQSLSQETKEPDALIDRHFTVEGIPPAKETTWIKKLVEIDGETVAVEAPEHWSDRSIAIACKHYLSACDEQSIKRMLRRVYNTITKWGIADGVFATESEAQIFEDELAFILIHRLGTFNSPVWYNLGVEAEPLLNACFLNTVEDSAESITALATKEVNIFKWGAGTGCNWSHLRSSREKVRGGGNASGPVSFMIANDVEASKWKSGGKHRRAARLDRLDIGHPDIKEFIGVKRHYENMVRALVKVGWSTDMHDPLSTSNTVPMQSTNTSVGLTDQFMHAVENNENWPLILPTTGDVSEVVKARDLMRLIAECAHDCGDPGVQFDDTINKWSFLSDIEKINTSNPCQPAWATVLSTDGVRALSTIDVGDRIWSGKQWTTVTQKVHTGQKMVYAYVTDVGTFYGTENHRVVSNDQKIEVKDAKSIDFAPNPFSTLQNVLKGSHPITRVEPVGVYDVWDLTVDDPDHTYWTDNLLVSNCSEVFNADNVSCNLANMNLLPANEQPLPDEDILQISQVFATALDIMLDHGRYPAPIIAQTTKAYRPLGIGWCNLGAAILAQGWAYDSREGRLWASHVASLTTAAACLQSIKLAKRRGPFTHAEQCTGSTSHVLRMHLEHAPDLDTRSIWQEVCSEFNRGNLLRNSALTCAMPTGTTGLLLDAETTGIEPLVMLQTLKKLSYGGELVLTARCVVLALKKLGYQHVEELAQQILEKNNAVGLVADKHLPVFDTSYSGASERYISIDGHLKMLAALQPHLSMGISKTGALPHSATVEDVEQTYIKAWKLGLKSLAIYRDGSKAIQVLGGTEQEPTTYAWGERKPLPHTREGLIHKFDLDGTEVYLSAGMYEDGRLGEIWITANKHGATITGLLDSVAIAVSMALQHGVPLEALATKFKGLKFSPAGFCEGTFYTSLVDYIFRWLEDQFPGGMRTSGEDVPPASNGWTDNGTPSLSGDLSAREMCPNCGEFMIPNGVCHLCPSCGGTFGGCG